MGAKSNVNFSHLSEEEQIQRYANLKREYETLREKVVNLQEEEFLEHEQKGGSTRFKRPVPLTHGLVQLQKAREVLQGYREHEMEDSERLI